MSQDRSSVCRARHFEFEYSISMTIKETGVFGSACTYLFSILTSGCATQYVWWNKWGPWKQTEIHQNSVFDDLQQPTFAANQFIKISWSIFRSLSPHPGHHQRPTNCWGAGYGDQSSWNGQIYPSLGRDTKATLIWARFGKSCPSRCMENLAWQESCILLFCGFFWWGLKNHQVFFGGREPAENHRKPVSLPGLPILWAVM